jgi:Nitrite/Sulfite reductase ferredoxin-like half domain
MLSPEAAMTESAAIESAAPANAVECYKASMDGDGLRILQHLPQIIRRGYESLAPAEKELLKWLGVFYRKPTPGYFMMRVRMPNGFANSQQLRVIADLGGRLGLPRLQNQDRWKAGGRSSGVRWGTYRCASDPRQRDPRNGTLRRIISGCYRQCSERLPWRACAGAAIGERSSICGGGDRRLGFVARYAQLLFTRIGRPV